MNPRLAWGILGTGHIAHKMAAAIRESRTGMIVAVGSRTLRQADAFGAEFDIPHRHASYEALVTDPEVQVVYVSLLNHLHLEWAIRCAEAGKHILCEKPLALNHAQATRLVKAAHVHRIFLMEAFMYRCHPQTEALCKLVRNGSLGEVRLIEAHFGYTVSNHNAHTRLSHAMGGGGILDVGCYPVSMARLIAGAATGKPFAEPITLHGSGHIGKESRIDEWASATLRFPGNLLAQVSCACRLHIEPTLDVWGSEGHLHVAFPWKPLGPESVLLLHKPGETKAREIHVASDASLYAIQVDTVGRHILAGKLEATSPAMGWEDSLGNMNVLDQWRRAIGLVYDGE